MKRFWRQTSLVLLNEFADALRSRRALVALVLYLAAGVLTTNSAINILQKLEGELSSALQLEAPDRAGTVSSAIWKSERFRRMVARSVGEDSLVADLIGTPPIVLIYGGLAFFYTPLLAILIASARVAEEMASGSARYALIRTSRLSWSTGKFLGQALLVGLALGLSGAGAWVVAAVRMAAEEGASVAVGMAVTAGRAWIISLPFVGLAVGVSHWTRSPGRATALAIVAMLALAVLAWLSERYYGSGLRELWHLAHMFTAQRDRLDLWRNDPAHFVPAVAHLAVLGWCYMLMGYAVFRRRDL